MRKYWEPFNNLSGNYSNMYIEVTRSTYKTAGQTFLKEYFIVLDIAGGRRENERMTNNHTVVYFLYNQWFKYEKALMKWIWKC